MNKKAIRNLWCAVLLQAIADLDSEQQRPIVVSWFLSPSLEVGSFLWICEAIDFGENDIKNFVELI